jgi:ankyrin repeat protein
VAAKKNDSVLVRLLIKTYKARVNVFDDDGCTPLHICCYENNIEALQGLLDNDADFQKGTRLSALETPVSICVKYQHDTCLKVIFDSNSGFNWKRYFSQLPRSPMLCDFPSITSMELLVEHALDINACDERGNTFLHYLVDKKDIDYEKYVEKLIEKCADFNRQNQLGRTPFLDALEKNNHQLLAVFLARIDVTNINVVDTLSNTALHYCKYLHERFIYESVLTTNPMALNTQNRDGQTPLHDAIQCDNTLFAQFLLQHNCDVNLINKDGNTPVHMAALDDNVRMCKLLMKYAQVDLTATNKLGKTPLHLACANEKANVAAILMNKMTVEHINLVDSQGRTALHECAENIDGFLARYLIRHGADDNAHDVRGNTVIHLSAEKGDLHCSNNDEHRHIVLFFMFVCFCLLEVMLNFFEH